MKNENQEIKNEFEEIKNQIAAAKSDIFVQVQDNLIPDLEKQVCDQINVKLM